jgi:hypothetical protein
MNDAKFISQYRSILNQLAGLKDLIASTGHFYGAMGATVHRHDLVINVRIIETLDAECS